MLDPDRKTFLKGKKKKKFEFVVKAVYSTFFHCSQALFPILTDSGLWGRFRLLDPAQGKTKCYTNLNKKYSFEEKKRNFFFF